MLQPIDSSLISDNVFKLISTDWMLVTAGDLQSYNTMTASWGALGELWSKKIAICFVRPVRHTYPFLEKADSFTLAFFDESHRDTLKLCGTKSGRDIDKMSLPGMTPMESLTGSVYFSEARLVLDCRKIYTHDLDAEMFLDHKIHDEYPDKDYHRMYIGEIMQCLTR